MIRCYGCRVKKYWSTPKSIVRSSICLIVSSFLSKPNKSLIKSKTFFLLLVKWNQQISYSLVKVTCVLIWDIQRIILCIAVKQKAEKEPRYIQQRTRMWNEKTKRHLKENLYIKFIILSYYFTRLELKTSHSLHLSKSLFRLTVCKNAFLNSDFETFWKSEF